MLLIYSLNGLSLALADKSWLDVYYNYKSDIAGNGNRSNSNK